MKHSAEVLVFAWVVIGWDLIAAIVITAIVVRLIRLQQKIRRLEERDKPQLYQVAWSRAAVPSTPRFPPDVEPPMFTRHPRRREVRE
jgi:hypothetical protein